MIAFYASETTAAHEDAVETFLRQAAEEECGGPLDDKQFVEWLNGRDILTEEQLEWRRSKEVRLTEKFENTISLCSDIFGRRLALPQL